MATQCQTPGRAKTTGRRLRRCGRCSWDRDQARHLDTRGSSTMIGALKQRLPIQEDRPASMSALGSSHIPCILRTGLAKTDKRFALPVNLQVLKPAPKAHRAQSTTTTLTVKCLSCRRPRSYGSRGILKAGGGRARLVPAEVGSIKKRTEAERCAVKGIKNIQLQDRRVDRVGRWVFAALSHI